MKWNMILISLTGRNSGPGTKTSSPRVAACAAALAVSGCAATTTGDYCDIAGPMYFDDTDTVTWLYENDDTLLVDIVVNNETWAELCAGKTSP